MDGDYVNWDKSPSESVAVSSTIEQLNVFIAQTTISGVHFIRYWVTYGISVCILERTRHLYLITLSSGLMFPVASKNLITWAEQSLWVLLKMAVGVVQGNWT